MALVNLTYSRNRWNGQFRVYNQEKSVDFTIGKGEVHTGISPMPTITELKFDFTGTAPDNNEYTSYRFMSLLYDGNTGLLIQWADGKKDLVDVSGRTCGVLLDIGTKANGLLVVIIDDGDIGKDNMVWEEFENVAGRVPAK